MPNKAAHLTRGRWWLKLFFDLSDPIVISEQVPWNDRHHMRVFLVNVVLLAILGCGRTPQGDQAAKLERVRAAAEQLAAPEDRDAFATATVVLGLQDFPLSVVGLRVPLEGASNAVIVTFEVDHFDSHTVEQLAAQVIEDFTRAKNGSGSG